MVVWERRDFGNGCFWEIFENGFGGWWTGAQGVLQPPVTPMGGFER
jgi:hypothetical protein